MAVPKPPAFDAQTSADAWTEHVLKEDGSSYASFAKFPGWKRWVDGLRDSVQKNEVRLNDQKRNLDQHTSEIANLEQRVAALEARPESPFPGSG